MQSRRDLLKYFGIGATIVPVLGGTPITDVPAKLIQEPKIDLIKPDDFKIEITEAGLDELYQIKNHGRGHIQVEVTTPEGLKFKLSGATDFHIDYMSPQPIPYSPKTMGMLTNRTGFIDTARRAILQHDPVVKWELQGIMVRTPKL